MVIIICEQLKTVRELIYTPVFVGYCFNKLTIAKILYKAIGIYHSDCLLFHVIFRLTTKLVYPIYYLAELPLNSAATRATLDKCILQWFRPRGVFCRYPTHYSLRPPWLNHYIKSLSMGRGGRSRQVIECCLFQDIK